MVRAHQAIARLAGHAPGWYLMYGPATRMYWAFPTFAGGARGLVLADHDPEALIALIQMAEADLQRSR